jgi:hypothetical protein
MPEKSVLIIGAHAADFIWRAVGTIAIDLYGPRDYAKRMAEK